MASKTLGSAHIVGSYISIEPNYTLKLLKNKNESYLSDLDEDIRKNILVLLTIYEMIHDFGGGRPPLNYQEAVRNYITSIREQFRKKTNGVLFDEELIFSSGNVENFFKKLVDENIILINEDEIATTTYSTIQSQILQSKKIVTIENKHEDDLKALSNDNARRFFGNFIFDFFLDNQQVTDSAAGETKNQNISLNLICDATGGSNSLIAKCTGKQDGSQNNSSGRLINYVTGLFTKFDSAVYIPNLYTVLQKGFYTTGQEIGDRNVLDDLIKQLYLQHWSHVDGQEINIQNNFISDTYQHMLNERHQLNTNNQKQEFKQGPSVANLSCYIATNGKNCTTSINNMYTFNSSILNTFGEPLKQQFLFDMKRNGDHLQVLATHKLNILNKTNGKYYIFCSIDRLAIQFARLIGVPCILINNTTGEMTLYKGNFSQLPGEGNEKLIEISIIRNKIEKLKNKLENLNVVEANKQYYFENKLTKKYNNLLPNMYENAKNILTVISQITEDFKSKIKKIIEKKLLRHLTNTDLRNNIKNSIEIYLKIQINKLNELKRELNGITPSSYEEIFKILNKFHFEKFNLEKNEQEIEKYKQEIDNVLSKLDKLIPKKRINFLFNQDILSQIAELLEEIINWSRLPKRAREEIITEHYERLNEKFTAIFTDQPVEFNVNNLKKSKENRLWFLNNIFISYISPQGETKAAETKAAETKAAQALEAIDDVDMGENNIEDDEITGETKRQDVNMNEIKELEQTIKNLEQILANLTQNETKAISVEESNKSSTLGKRNKYSPPLTNSQETKKSLGSTIADRVKRRRRRKEKNGIMSGGFTNNFQAETTLFTEDFYYYLLEFLNNYKQTTEVIITVENIDNFIINVINKLLSKYDDLLNEFKFCYKVMNDILKILNSEEIHNNTVPLTRNKLNQFQINIQNLSNSDLQELYNKQKGRVYAFIFILIKLTGIILENDHNKINYLRELFNPEINSKNPTNKTQENIEEADTYISTEVDFCKLDFLGLLENIENDIFSHQIPFFNQANGLFISRSARIEQAARLRAQEAAPAAAEHKGGKKTRRRKRKKRKNKTKRRVKKRKKRKQTNKNKKRKYKNRTKKRYKKR